MSELEENHPFSSSTEITVKWDPLKVIESAVNAGQVVRSSYGCEDKYAIIWLNSQVANEELFLSLWNEASCRMLIDGSANHWRGLYRKFPDLVQLPHFVCGNFDYIQRETLEVLKRHEEDIAFVKFEQPDPDSSDFTESLRLLISKVNDNHSSFENITHIIASSETSIHHEFMGNVETLFQCSDKIQTFLTSSTSITFLLTEGKHRVNCGKTNPNHPFISCTEVALLPCGLPCKVTTKGLLPDFTEETLAFGKKIGMNRKVVGIANEQYVLEVLTSKPILCSMSYNFDNQLKNVW